MGLRVKSESALKNHPQVRSHAGFVISFNDTCTMEVWEQKMSEEANIQMKTFHKDKDSFPFFEKAKKRTGKYAE